MVAPHTIKERMEVVGSDGVHVGTVDHMEGADEMKLTAGDEEADGRVQPAGRVRGQRSRGGQLPGQQPDAPGAQQACHQGEDDRQRQRAPGQRGAGRDRSRDGGAGGHVGDRLEQHLTQANCVSTQPGRGSGNGLLCGRHGVMIARTFRRAQT